MEKIKKINNNHSNFCKSKSYYLSPNVFRLWSDLFSTKGGERYKIITDHFGSVRYVVRASDGAIVQQMEYDSFGNVLYDSNPGFIPFGFAGGIYDPDTKMIKFGARDYDPEVGRWTSKDPILFSNGDSNLLAYSKFDPINNMDNNGYWTLGYGYTVSGGIGGLFEFQISLVIDSELNVGLLIGPGGGGIGGTAASLTTTISWTNAKDIFDLEGLCHQMGASAGAGLVVGGEYLMEESNKYQGANINIGAGLELGAYAVPVEFHGTEQGAIIKKLFNVKDIAAKVWNWITNIF